jgi:hypothetical protein
MSARTLEAESIARTLTLFSTADAAATWRSRFDAAPVDAREDVLHDWQDEIEAGLARNFDPDVAAARLGLLNYLTG